MPANLVFLHRLPLPTAEESCDLLIDKISDEHDKVELFTPERGTVLFGENAIPHIQFVAIPTVNFEERKKEGDHAEETSDV